MSNPLPYRVECQHPPSYRYETIAAFNVERVAIEYARSCHKANGARGLSYRVRKGQRVQIVMLGAFNVADPR